jgi:hypothetical protein
MAHICPENEMDETKTKVVIIPLNETHAALQEDGWLGKLHSHALNCLLFKSLMTTYDPDFCD